MAWLVTVDVAAVARRRSRETTHHFNDFDAWRELTGPHGGEHSPFVQTQRLNVLYSEVDPELMLDPNEILKKEEVPQQRRPWMINRE